MAEGWTYRLRYGNRHLELSEGKLTVGRSRHCDLSIQEPSISRKHVFMTVDDGSIRLQDLGSSNGTFVNDDKILGESILADGDELRLGNAELEVEIRSGEETADVRPKKTAPRAEPAAESSGETDVPEESPDPRRPAPYKAMFVQMGSGANPDDPTKHLDSPDIEWDVLQAERGGFWPRLGAVAVDGLWVSALAWAGYQVGGLAGALVAPVILVLVTWLGWGVWGTTPGKRLFGLYVYAVDTEEPDRPGTGLLVAAIRVLSSVLSVMLFGLGFGMIAFSSTRLALHDRLASTFVVRKVAPRVSDPDTGSSR